MNRKERRLRQKELNRQIRQRERELKRNIKNINVKADDGYLSEGQAIKFLEDIASLNHAQKKKYGYTE